MVIGIPYAEPPTSQLRFAAPVLKAEPGVANLDASKYGVSCPVGGVRASLIYTIVLHLELIGAR